MSDNTFNQKCIFFKKKLPKNLHYSKKYNIFAVDLRKLSQIRTYCIRVCDLFGYSRM